MAKKKVEESEEFVAEEMPVVEAEPVAPAPVAVESVDKAAHRKELLSRLQALKEASQAPNFVPAENEEAKAINAELLVLGAEPQDDVAARLARQQVPNADKYAKK